MRLIVATTLCIMLSGCLCLPERGKGEGVDTGYFGSCWNEMSSGPKNQIIFPKDAL